MKKTPKIRLFVPDDLSAQATLTCDPNQTHYLRNVMRKSEGDQICVFNGRDGVWIAEITKISKKSCDISVVECCCEQVSSPDVWLLFAPIKKAAQDFTVQKATELGVSCLCPVFTEFSDTNRVNVDRMSSISIEAAEQSERMDVPDAKDPQKLKEVLEHWDEDRLLLVAAERQGVQTIHAIAEENESKKYAVLIGPEGGFSSAEFDYLFGFGFVRFFTLGPRILKAETAAAASLACLNMVCDL